MKKLYAVLIVCMLFFAACGDEPGNGLDLSGSNMDLVRPEIQILMTNGNQILDTVADTYTGLTNADIKGLVKGVADYALFPVDFASGVAFADRMKAYLGGDNNLQNALLINSDIAAGREPGASLPGRLPRRMSRSVDAQQVSSFLDQAGDGLMTSCPEAGIACKVVSFVVGLFGKKKPSIEQRILNAVDALGKTVEGYQNENRQYFGAILGKSDQILNSLATMSGEINSKFADIQGQGFMGDMADIRDGFNGVINTCNTAPTVTDVSNTSYFYFITSGGFMTHIEQFFTTASNIHYWAVNNTNLSGYTQWIGQDAATRGDKRLIYVTLYENYTGYSFTGPHTYYLGFSNPKNYLMLSIGDLDLLASMMLTRIAMNVYLYLDEATLATANATLAQYFLNKIAPIKASINQAFQSIENTYATWMGSPGNAFSTYAGSQFISEVGHSLQGWEAHTSFTNRGPIYQSGPGTIFGEEMSVRILNATVFNAETKLARENSYLVFFASRLMALETQLRSYLPNPLQ